MKKKEEGALGQGVIFKRLTLHNCTGTCQGWREREVKDAKRKGYTTESFQG